MPPDARLEPVVAYDELPFHIGVADTPSNEPFPDVLPFAAATDPGTGRLVQVPDPRIVSELDRVYRRGSMLGTPLSAEGLGRSYADDLLAFISRSLGGEVRGRAVLEIGCGTGYLLARLRDLGADVLGVEPGAQAETGAAEHGVAILRAPFVGGGQFGGRRFDVILHHCVLEHVPDPIDFLERQREMLSPEGAVILGVPDEDPYISSGDISTLAHEHWSFFTHTSLRATLERSGLYAERIEPGGGGGALYAVARPSSARNDPPTAPANSAGFAGAASRLLMALDGYLETARTAGRTVGLWPAARALNYVHVLRPTSPFRWFDDEPALRGKYYPPVPVPVEGRADAIARPVDEMLLVTRTFGAKLRGELTRISEMARTRLTLLDDLLEDRT